MPMLYTAITGYRTQKIHLKKLWYFIFAQNINVVYLLSSNKYPKSLLSKNKKDISTLVRFYIIKMIYMDVLA